MESTDLGMISRNRTLLCLIKSCIHKWQYFLSIAELSAPFGSPDFLGPNIFGGQKFYGAQILGAKNIW
jgi:hypothetical protein